MNACTDHWFKFWSRMTLGCAALFASMAFAQPAGPLAGLTPKQLQDGTAKLVGRYSPAQKLRLVVGLEHPNLAAEEAFLKELGNQDSPNFHKFLSADEWNKRFAPSAASEQSVIDWAQSQGLTVTQRYPNRLLVDLEGQAQQVEAALGITLNAYQIGSRTAYSNTADPVIPATLRPIIHSIGGLNSIQVLKPMSKAPVEPNFADYSAGPAKAAAAGASANAKSKPPFMTKALGPVANLTNGAYDPTDLYSSNAYDVQALYNQGHCCNPLANAGVTPPNSSIAIATAGAQDTNDFVGFHNTYTYLAYHYQIYYIDGTPSCCDKEGTMDFEWSTAWSNSFGSYVDTSMVYMYDGVNANFSTFTDVYNHILADGNAKIFSTSWGCEEVACTPTSVMDTDHGIFNAMVGTGMTLVAASGDQGAAAGCSNGNAVQYPASDPNVVGAGGTTLSMTTGSYFSETAWSGGPDGCGYNDGGSTGGVSAYYGAPYYQNSIGITGYRQVPDLALNADWYNTPQNIYFGGGLQTNGGTSIVAPEIAGFFAQANAYLDFVQTVNGGCWATAACAPLGNANNYLYYFYANPGYAPHYPFYDIVSGCNDNDVTSYFGLGYYCAGQGYDAVTGLGSFNALQLARALITYRAGDYVPPTASITGPALNHWYNSDQFVSWSVSDAGETSLPATGVSGYSQSWDSFIADATSEATPGSGDSFYSGPQYPNSTTGYLYVSWAGQGCHTANVRSWDNSGFSGYQTYGPVCYDTIAPVTTATLSGTLVSGTYTSPVTVKLAATDANSGVKGTLHKLDSGAYTAYSAPFVVAALGAHTVSDYSTDVAGNVEAAKSKTFTLKSDSKAALAASSASSVYGVSVTFTATLSATTGATPTGTVTFKNGTTTMGTATLTAGKATFATGALLVGAHAITASYGGSGTDMSSVSTAVTHTVTKAATTTTLASSLNPATVGKSVTFTATIKDAHGGAIAGTVTFKNGAVTLGTASVSGTTGKATFATTKLAKGKHSITAAYAGGPNTNASTSAALAEVVN